VAGQHRQPNPLDLLNRYRLELFHAHCSLIDQLFLKHWETYLQQSPRPVTNHQWNCILVDDRPTRQTRTCILNTLLMTRLQGLITVYTPPEQVEAFRELIAPFSNFASIQALSGEQASNSLSKDAYNKILKQSGFWEAVKGDRVLIFQPDSLLIEPLELASLRYDYAGSPWKKGRTISCEFPVYDPLHQWIGTSWSNQALCGDSPDTTTNGNGGLSIRNPKLMHAICAAHSQNSPDNEPEDVFFARHIYSGNYKANLPSLAQLNRLFSESTYNDCSGFHASWYYLEASEQAKLYEKHVKHVIGLLLGLR